MDSISIVTVILLSYKRPFNIQKIINELLPCNDVDRIIVSNNNSSINLNDWVDIDNDCVRIMNQKENKGCGFRWRIAKEFRSNYYIAVDDDTFLNYKQIGFLIDRIKKSPEIPHGFFGSRYDSIKQFQIPKFYKNTNRLVNVLHQVYAVTNVHVDNYFNFLSVIERDNPIIAKIIEDIADDILISHTGNGLPQIYNMGSINICKSSLSEGIATLRRDGFFEKRNQVYYTIQKFVSG